MLKFFINFNFKKQISRNPGSKKQIQLTTASDKAILNFYKYKKAIKQP